MAFSKTAKARVTQPSIVQGSWEELRSKSTTPQSFEIRKAAHVVLQQYDPKQYLLSHATIIASVDTEIPGLHLGSQMFDGMQIDRKYPDFYVTTGTQKFINQNSDSWERKLLLATYRSFIGGQSYLEHVQIPELSKGRIIDAAARDIGESIYVDILVATDRKHKELVSAISAGNISTLSMGCFTPNTLVTLHDGRRIPIKDVMPGELVVTHKGRVREVANKQIHGGVWDMRRIHVVGVPDAIEATTNHKFFVLRPAKVCGCGCGLSLDHSDKAPERRICKRFRSGHSQKVLNTHGKYSPEELALRTQRLEEIHKLHIEEVQAEDLRVGDYVVFPRAPNRKDRGDVSKARLLGYFLAEGSFLKRSGEPCEVQFNFSMKEKETYVKEVVRLLKASFPKCKPWVQDRVDRDTCVVHVTGFPIVNWFLKNGGEYSYGKCLSPEVMGWSNEAHLNLIGAWINGDGNLHAKNDTVGTTTSFQLANQLHFLSVKCGLTVRLRCDFNGKTSSSIEAVEGGVSCRGESNGKLAAFHLYYPTSNHDRLVEVTTKYPRKVTKELKFRDFEGNMIYPITQIDSFEYQGFVYDLEVEGDHSYLVHGVAVHNCSCTFTICSKCGNVAIDETCLCRHIKYEKGSTFFDAKGIRRKVAELCGHYTDPKSVQFIEASWVANPAFKGAVLRSILDPQNAKLSETNRQKIQVAFSKPVQVPSSSLQKAARLAPVGVGSMAVPSDHLAYLYEGPSLGSLKIPASFSGQDSASAKRDSRLSILAQEDFPGQAEISEPKKETPESPFKKTVDDLYTTLVREVSQRVRKDLEQSETEKSREVLDENKSNQSLIKSALRFPKWQQRAKTVLTSVKNPQHAQSVLAGLILHDFGGWEAVAAANRFSGREILVIDRLLSRMTKKSSMAGDSRLYRVVIAVGGTAPYPDVNTYLATCREVMKSVPTESERAQLIEKGKLFALGL